MFGIIMEKKKKINLLHFSKIEGVVFIRLIGPLFSLLNLSRRSDKKHAICVDLQAICREAELTHPQNISFLLTE